MAFGLLYSCRSGDGGFNILPSQQAARRLPLDGGVCRRGIKTRAVDASNANKLIIAVDCTLFQYGWVAVGTKMLSVACIYRLGARGMRHTCLCSGYEGLRVGRHKHRAQCRWQGWLMLSVNSACGFYMCLVCFCVLRCNGYFGLRRFNPVLIYCLPMLYAAYPSVQVDMYHASPLLPMKDEGIMETALHALNTVREQTA